MGDLVPRKSLYTSTRLYGVIFQNIIVFRHYYENVRSKYVVSSLLCSIVNSKYVHEHFVLSHI